MGHHNAAAVQTSLAVAHNRTKSGEYSEGDEIRGTEEAPKSFFVVAIRCVQRRSLSQVQWAREAEFA